VAKGSTPPPDNHLDESWVEHLAHIGLIRTSTRRIRRIHLVVLTVVVALIAIVALIVALDDHRQDSRQTALTVGQRDARAAADLISDRLREVETIAISIATDLTIGDATPASISDRLKKDLTANPGFWGVGACYERSDSNPDEDLFGPVLGQVVSTGPADQRSNCPYWTRPDSNVTYTPVIYEYTYLDRGAWYQRPRDEGAQWNSPYFGATSRRMVAEYGAPFFDQDIVGTTERPAGVVFANFTLDQINRSLSWLNLGGRGYGFLISQEGDFVSHPIDDYWRDQLNVVDIARVDDNTELELFAQQAMAGESGVIDFRDQLTGQDAWLFFERVEATGWTLGSVVIKGEVVGRDQTSHHLLMWIGAAALIALLGVLVIAFRAFRGELWTYWGISFSFTLAAVIGIGYIWTLAQTTPELDAGLGADGESLTETVSSFRGELAGVERLPEAIDVFAGVSIDSIETDEAGDLVLSGIAWQRYFDLEDAALAPPGFIVSDDIGDTKFEIRYDITTGSERSIGWSFRSTLQGPTDLSRYPLDRGVISLRLLHREFGRPIILIPDIPEYPLIVPIAQPGLGDRFNLDGWDVERSYFGYEPNPFNTSFGIPDFTVRRDAPELFFNILLARDFLDPFVSRMLPVIVVSVLVFALLMIVTRTRLTPEEFGTSNALAALAFLGGLMFVLIIGHNSLRSSLRASEIIYLEYFYFIMYAAILVVATRVISFAFGIRVGWVHYRDRFVAERLYWPLVTGATLVITWLVFY
jgi:hypothetical protein